MKVQFTISIKFMLTDVFSCVFLFGCVFIYIFIIFSFRSVPASGLDAVIPSANQLTIFYNGSVCVYDGIPAEKVCPCCTFKSWINLAAVVSSILALTLHVASLWCNSNHTLFYLLTGAWNNAYCCCCCQVYWNEEDCDPNYPHFTRSL